MQPELKILIIGVLIGVFSCALIIVYYNLEASQNYLYKPIMVCTEYYYTTNDKNEAIQGNCKYFQQLYRQINVWN
jgi:hypothetical protein